MPHAKAQRKEEYLQSNKKNIRVHQRLSAANILMVGFNRRLAAVAKYILLRYENGSNAVINYFANGNKAYSKERIEVHSQARSLVMDNWRTLRGFGFKGFSRLKKKQDKGHSEQFRLLIDRVKNGGEALISFGEIVNTTRTSFGAVESLREGRWVNVGKG